MAGCIMASTAIVLFCYFITYLTDLCHLLLVWHLSFGINEMSIVLFFMRHNEPIKDLDCVMKLVYLQYYHHTRKADICIYILAALMCFSVHVPFNLLLSFTKMVIESKSYRWLSSKGKDT